MAQRNLMVKSVVQLLSNTVCTKEHVAAAGSGAGGVPPQEVGDGHSGTVFMLGMTDCPGQQYRTPLTTIPVSPAHNASPLHAG
jgi:hypothetical protein